MGKPSRALREARRDAKRALEAFYDLTEKLQKLGEEFGCVAGSNRVLWLRQMLEARRAMIAAEKVPADLARLVIAARVVAFEDQSPEALAELDKASEAFADRVPWGEV